MVYKNYNLGPKCHQKGSFCHWFPQFYSPDNSKCNSLHTTVLRSVLGEVTLMYLKQFLLCCNQTQTEYAAYVSRVSSSSLSSYIEMETLLQKIKLKHATQLYFALVCHVFPHSVATDTVEEKTYSICIKLFFSEMKTIINPMQM